MLVSLMHLAIITCEYKGMEQNVYVVFFLKCNLGFVLATARIVSKGFILSNSTQNKFNCFNTEYTHASGRQTRSDKEPRDSGTVFK